MKYKITFLLLTFSVIVWAQNKTILLHNYKFKIKTVSENNSYGEPIQKIQVLRNNSILLTHITNEIIGDCNSESIEIGDYEVTASSIIFYSYWNFYGDAPVSPYGVRKQIYTIDESGKLVLTHSEIYIETSRQGWNENKGIVFLFTSPKNEIEKKALNDYVLDVEKTYNAKFVFELSKDILINEVKNKLQRPIKNATKDWKKTDK